MALTKITSTNIQAGAIESSSLETSGATAGTYGSASQIPVLSVNAQGIVYAISEATVAGVTAFDYNTTTGVIDIDTADGSNFSTNITLGPFDTGDLAEGTNLYYTDARVANYLTTNSYATQSYADQAESDAITAANAYTDTSVSTAISNLINSAPAALDTLDELAAALGDDANFASTVTNNLALKADKATTITAGTGLSGGGDLSANRTVAIANTGVTAGSYGTSTAIPVLTINAQGQITAASTTNITVGDGTLTVNTGSGLTGSGTFTANQTTAGTITLSHADTSTQASVNNSGGTVIQDVTVDGFGHVTGLASTDLTTQFLGINAKATDSDALDGLNSTQFLRSDTSDTMTGNLIMDGASIGIGTSSPNLMLDLKGSGNSWSTAPIIRMWDSYNSKGWVVGNANNYTPGDFYIRQVAGEDSYPSSTNQEFTIKASGNVGIGTTSPSSTLDVRSSTDLGSVVRKNFGGTANTSSRVALTVWGEDFDNATATDSTNIGPMIGFGARLDSATPNTGDIRAGIAYSYNGDLTFHAKVAVSVADGSNERMRIDGDTGNVGIGTTSPTAKLHVNGDVKMEGSYLKLPTGTTNPSSPSVGYSYFKSDTGELKIYDGSDWGSITFSPPPTVSVTSGLIFAVESWNPDCISSTSDGTITDIIGGKIGYATNQRSDSPTNNVSPQMVTDSADVGDVWNFNGGTTPDWWISFPDTSGFPSGSAARTYSVWFKADSVTLNALGGQDGSPTWTGGSNLTNTTAYMLCERGNGWEITGHAYDQYIGVSETATNVWVNIVASDDGSTLRFYRNGTLIGSVASTGFNTSSTNFFIGRHWSKEDLAGINGKISSWYFWNRGISAAEALTQYNDLKGLHGL